MKKEWNDRVKKHGFTIIELLTVMSIIVILISLLTPALNRVRRYALDVKQKAQFHAIGIGLEAFNSEFDGYPDSNAVDDLGKNYCGAMKLCEAMVGQDLKGFNPTSRFERRGFIGTLTTTPWTDPSGYVMPYPPKDYPTAPSYNESVKTRKTYLELDNANAYQIKDIYDSTAGGFSNYNSFDPCAFVLCDSYNRVTNKNAGKKMGMPILYYRADPAKFAFPINTETPTNMQTKAFMYTYNYKDNQDLIDMGMPWFVGPAHPLASGGATDDGVTIVDCPKRFYDIVRDKKVVTDDKPYKADSYILMSAGFDGQYGTKDDVYNFIGN